MRLVIYLRVSSDSMWKTFLHVFQIYVPRLIDGVRNTRVINSAVYLREIFRQDFVIGNALYAGVARAQYLDQ